MVAYPACGRMGNEANKKNHYGTAYVLQNTKKQSTRTLGSREDIPRILRLLKEKHPTPSPTEKAHCTRYVLTQSGNCWCLTKKQLSSRSTTHACHTSQIPIIMWGGPIEVGGSSFRASKGAWKSP